MSNYTTLWRRIVIPLEIALFGGSLAGLVVLFVEASKPNAPLGYGIAGIVVTVIFFISGGDSLRRILAKEGFKRRLANYISRGKLLHMKRNKVDVVSDEYKIEVQNLIEEVKGDLRKNERESEVIRVVGGLEFKFGDLNGVSDKEGYKKGQIGHVISCLVDNLIELQEREK